MTCYLCPNRDVKNSECSKDIKNPGADWLILTGSPPYKGASGLIGSENIILKSYLDKALEVYKSKFGHSITYNTAYVVSSLDKDLDPGYCFERLRAFINDVKPKRILNFASEYFSLFTGRKIPEMDLFGTYTYIDDTYKVEHFLSIKNILKNRAIRPYWEKLFFYKILNPPNPFWKSYDDCKVVNVNDPNKACKIISGILQRAGQPNFNDKFLLGYDTEFNTESGRILCGALCWDPNNVVTFPEHVLQNHDFVKSLEKLFLDSRVVVAAHSWKADASISEQLGVSHEVFLKNPFVDTEILRKIFNPELNSGLDYTEYMVGLGGHKKKFHDTLKNKKGSGYEIAYDKDPVFTQWYCGLDTLATYRLAILYYDTLSKMGLLSAYTDLYHPLGAVLYDAEKIGLQVDLSVHKSLSEYLQSEITNQETLILSNPTLQKVAKNSNKIKNGEFNIASSDHMRELLFDNPLGFKQKSKKQTNKGKASTDKYVVKSLHGKVGIVDNILEHSRLSTLHNTYVKGWAKRWDSAYKLHTYFKLVRTGRLSSSNPNVQNFPRVSSPETKLLRSCIVSPNPDLCLLEVDFGQAELRQMAQESGDPELLKAYMDRVDIHRKTAAFVSGCKIEDVQKKSRQAAKCFHPDTEVMTRSGWKRILDLDPDEEVLQATTIDKQKPILDWIVPKQVYSMPNEYDFLYHIKNEGIDIKVTPDHWMLSITKGGKYSKVLPQNFNGIRYWPNAGIFEGSIEIPEKDLRLAVAIQADGSITPDQAVRFGFSKKRKIKRLEHMLKTSNIPYRKSQRRNGTIHFYISRKDICHVTKLLDDKKFPIWWLDLNIDCKNVVLDETQYWDSHKRINWRAYQFSSAKSQNIDVLQMIATMSGRKTAIKKDKHVDVLIVRDVWKTRGGNASITKVPYTGDVACLAVDSGVVVIRDGVRKIPIITKQSFNFGLAFGMSEFRLKDYAKNDYGVDMTLEEAKEAKKKYFQLYKGIRRYQIRTIAQAHKDGCVWVNWVGNPVRVRWLSSIGSKDKKIRGSAERQAINTKIQGGAQEYTLRSMVTLHKLLISGQLPGIAAIIGTTHDSILTYAHKDMLDVACRAIGCVLVTQPTIRDVPLEVDFKSGDSLGEMSEGITINSLDKPQYPDYSKNQIIYGNYAL